MSLKTTIWQINCITNLYISENFSMWHCTQWTVARQKVWTKDNFGKVGLQFNDLDLKTSHKLLQCCTLRLKFMRLLFKWKGCLYRLEISLECRNSAILKLLVAALHSQQESHIPELCLLSLERKGGKNRVCFMVLKVPWREQVLTCIVWPEFFTQRSSSSYILSSMDFSCLYRADHSGAGYWISPQIVPIRKNWSLLSATGQSRRFWDTGSHVKWLSIASRRWSPNCRPLFF